MARFAAVVTTAVAPQTRPLPADNYRAVALVSHSFTKSIDEMVESLMEEWERATAHLSSPSATMNHRAFRELVGLGDSAVWPLIRLYQKRDGFMCYALSELTGQNPVAARDKGNLRAIRKAWLAWATANAPVRPQPIRQLLPTARTDQLAGYKPVLV